MCSLHIEDAHSKHAQAQVSDTLRALGNVFSYRMCSHIECVLIGIRHVTRPGSNVFSCRMCSHIECVLIGIRHVTCPGGNGGGVTQGVQHGRCCCQGRCWAGPGRRRCRRFPRLHGDERSQPPRAINLLNLLYIYTHIYTPLLLLRTLPLPLPLIVPQILSVEVPRLLGCRNSQK